VIQFNVECEYSGRTDTVCVFTLAPQRVKSPDYGSRFAGSRL
jgi:hypothetical protein